MLISSIKFWQFHLLTAFMIRLIVEVVSDLDVYSFIQFFYFINMAPLRSLKGFKENLIMRKATIPIPMFILQKRTIWIVIV